MAWVWRRELDQPAAPPAADPPAADRWQTTKGLAAVAALVGLFMTDLPRELGALAVAGLLLVSRRLSSRAMIGMVDWHLLLLFAALFVITDAFAATGLAARGLDWMTAHGLGLERLSVMTPLLLAASNTIGNVPAVMLILSVWPGAPQDALYALAVLSTLAGNFLLVGSLANIIVAERAAAAGVRLSFADHARCGIPMTLGALVLAALWLGWAGGVSS